MTNTRTKGLVFEREVAAAFTAAGFEVRGLEAGGDHLVISHDGHVLHVEAKRQERMQLPTWLRQQERDCPQGALRALVFRQSRRPAYVVEPFEQFVRREAAIGRILALLVDPAYADAMLTRRQIAEALAERAGHE